MIHEYALDPELLKSWAANERDYREFLREYGLGTPRLSSSFPKQNKSKFRSFYLQKSPSNTQSLQAQRYVEMVNYLAESLVYRDGFECTSTDWSENVLAEDMRKPFYGVLTSTVMDTPRCLTVTTMYSDGSIWNHQRQAQVARTYDSCFPLLRDILRLAKDKIVFIDPYGWNDRAVSFIGNLIGGVHHNRVHSAVPELILCYKRKRGGGSPDATYVKAQLAERLAFIQGLQLGVYELDDRPGHDVFHNRYLLTELGGVSLGHGVDLSENAAHSDELNLLRRQVYIQKWQQFVEDRSCFKLVSQA